MSQAPHTGRATVSLALVLIVALLLTVALHGRALVASSRLSAASPLPTPTGVVAATPTPSKNVLPALTREKTIWITETGVLAGKGAYSGGWPHIRRGAFHVLPLFR